jgi:hypothetical protein
MFTKLQRITNVVAKLTFYEIPRDRWRIVPAMEDERTQPLADHFHPQLLGYITQQVEFQHCDSSEKGTETAATTVSRLLPQFQYNMQYTWSHSILTYKVTFPKL